MIWKKKRTPPTLEGSCGRLRTRFQRPRISKIFENRAQNQHSELFKKCPSSDKMKFLIVFTTFLKKNENLGIFHPNRVSFSGSLLFQKNQNLFLRLTDAIKSKKSQFSSVLTWFVRCKNFFCFLFFFFLKRYCFERNFIFSQKVEFLQ